MKIIAFNGSPRKDWNTAVLLNEALKGASSNGAQTELVHLYDLTYRGCVSCFSCKEINGKSYGRCAVNDALTGVFKRVEEADAVILGSPIYLGSVSGMAQAFMERLIFPYLTYTDPPQSLFPKKIPCGIIFTMGVKEDMLEQLGYNLRFANTERLLKIIFGSAETILCCDTSHVQDYSKVFAPRFNAQEKLKRRKEVFPQDCRKAYEMGAGFVQK